MPHLFGLVEPRLQFEVVLVALISSSTEIMTNTAFSFDKAIGKELNGLVEAPTGFLRDSYRRVRRLGTKWLDSLLFLNEAILPEFRENV